MDNIVWHLVYYPKAGCFYNFLMGVSRLSLHTCQGNQQCIDWAVQMCMLHTVCAVRQSSMMTKAAGGQQQGPLSCVKLRRELLILQML